jgi:hypothetical protein
MIIKKAKKTPTEIESIVIALAKKINAEKHANFVMPGNLADNTPNPEAAARRFYSTSAIKIKTLPKGTQFDIFNVWQ